MATNRNGLKRPLEGGDDAVPPSKKQKVNDSTNYSINLANKLRQACEEGQLQLWSETDDNWTATYVHKVKNPAFVQSMTDSIISGLSKYLAKDQSFESKICDEIVTHCVDLRVVTLLASLAESQHEWDKTFVTDMKSENPMDARLLYYTSRDGVQSIDLEDLGNGEMSCVESLEEGSEEREKAEKAVKTIAKLLEESSKHGSVYRIRTPEFIGMGMEDAMDIISEEYANEGEEEDIDAPYEWLDFCHLRFLVFDSSEDDMLVVMYAECAWT